MVGTPSLTPCDIIIALCSVGQTGLCAHLPLLQQFI